MNSHYNLKNKVRCLSKFKDVYVICKQENKSLLDANILYERWDKVDYSLAELNKRLEKVHRVELNREDRTKSKCKCAYYQKNYICYHNVVVAVDQGLFDKPIE